MILNGNEMNDYGMYLLMWMIMVLFFLISGDDILIQHALLELGLTSHA